MAELKIGEISKPRFEFRSFGQCFCEAHKRMARLSVPVPEKVWERESDEIYTLSLHDALPIFAFALPYLFRYRNGKTGHSLVCLAEAQIGRAHV